MKYFSQITFKQIRAHVPLFIQKRWIIIAGVVSVCMILTTGYAVMQSRSTLVQKKLPIQVSKQSSATPTITLSPTPTVNISPTTRVNPTAVPTVKKVEIIVTPTSTPIPTADIPTNTPVPAPFFEITDISTVSEGAVFKDRNWCAHVVYKTNIPDNQLSLSYTFDSNSSYYWPINKEMCPSEELGAGTHRLNVWIVYENMSRHAEMTRTFVLKDEEPPQFVHWQNMHDGDTVDTRNVCPLFVYKDNIDNYDRFVFRHKVDGADWTIWERSIPCVQDLSNGPHSFAVQARDASGNESSVTVLNFNVQVN